MSIFKKLGWFFKAEKKHYIIGIIALIVVAIVQLIPPKIIGVIIDEIDGRLLTSSRLVMWISILVVAASLQYVFRFIWRTNIWGSAARTIVSTLYENGS